MIETERLLLRPHIAEDFPGCLAMWQDPQVIRYIGNVPSTEGEAWMRFLSYFGRWELMGYGMFAVIEKDSGDFLGEIGFSDFRRNLGPDFDPFHEGAWVMNQAGQGKGYAFEATAAAHDWLDRKFKPEKTVSIIDPDNAASIKLAGKLGYTETRRDEYKGDAVIVFERFKA
ncbi:GNAT family N-acetyltransferase [Parasphingorhabdus halotolerans]|uniref:GNAT family N-acetyltransferase n=1 Tax=Parasphingorhabdus halotolerans TaxID=2725558 RepID=A0A6H2DKG7_9SPHN|nr:GNAT family N-acetyltransferase [Parasphingorhabdus halotolerans]QJB69172.1 GNAT family N-acetyltransferase [Parasphingorhabdus halotolerans]